MNFEIRHYPNAAWNDDQETTVLGDPGEVIASFSAAYPALARAMADATVSATRSENGWLPCEQATAAWATARGVYALVVVD